MGSLSGVIGGLIGSGQSLPTVNIAQLMQTIQNAGQYQQQIINALPAEVQQQLAQYTASMNQGATAYQTGVTNQGNDYLSKISSLYGPNSDAANAQKSANTQAAFASVPGAQTAVRNAMAATGGLSRGNAGVALAQPVVQAAQNAGQANMNVNAQQTQAAQGATAQALTTVNNMQDQMFTQLFGMTKQQAQQILSSGNQALTTQLADLINQSNNQTNETLGVQGAAANNAYQNAVTRNQQQGQIWNGVANLGLQGIQAGMGYLPMGTGAPSMSPGYDSSMAGSMPNPMADAMNGVNSSALSLY